MSVTKKYSCDVCGAERKEANHWFLVYAPLDTTKSIFITAFSFANAEREEAINICGESCLHKWISSNLYLLLPAVTASTLTTDKDLSTEEEKELPPVTAYMSEHEALMYDAEYQTRAYREETLLGEEEAQEKIALESNQRYREDQEDFDETIREDRV